MKDIPIQGRFHSVVHVDAVRSIVRLFDVPHKSGFPRVDQLRAPLRSAVDGEIITEGSLLRHALDNTLLKPLDWHRLLARTIRGDGRADFNIIAFGIVNPVPSSFRRAMNFELLKFNGWMSMQSKPLVQPKLGGIGRGTPSTPCGGTLPSGRGFPTHSIAIVGMAGRFPGAETLDELWDLMVAGESTVEPAPTERIGLDNISEKYLRRAWWGNFLRNPEGFDHKFFKMSPREAQACDPQRRVLLEVAYEALDDAGYFGAGSTSQARDWGCYIGAVMNNYYDNVSCHKETAYATIGTSRSYISGAISHFFGWAGPAITMDTACSSSLVAINAACKAIMAGECSYAIAGGTNVITSPYDYRNLAAAGFLSPTGQCKPFDADGDGYCRAEGVGVVVLKSLAKAIEENDHVLGVIVGSAVNQSFNDGQITVPDSHSQVSLQRKAMDAADLSPMDVSYIEAHGTGTRVGDPIEVAGIRESFCGPQRISPLYLSSIKGNIGHTEATAGVVGLIKVLLMMSRNMIPPQASHNSLNPSIPALEPDKIVIPRELTPWVGPGRVACIASYGAAGSNATALVREMPPCRPDPMLEVPAQPNARAQLPLFVAAATDTSLMSYCSKLLHWLRELRSKSPAKLHLSDVLFNIADKANHSLGCVLSIPISDLDDLESKLTRAGCGRISGSVPSPPKPMILVLGGQDKRYIGLSREFSRHSHVFRDHLDRCNDALISLGYQGIYPDIFQCAPLPSLVTLHAALFATQYASAKTWIDSGLKVDAVVGHSFGQLTALCICGALSMTDALKLVTGRASLIQKYWGPEPGSMLSLRASREKVDQILETLKPKLDYAEIACHNGPQNQVVVGSTQAIEALENHIDSHPDLQRSVHRQKLAVTHGFHSAYTEGFLPQLANLAKELDWRIPAIHLETCDEEHSFATLDHRLVVHHTRRPVFFQQAVERLARRYSASCWLSAGQDSSIVRLARRSLQQSRGHSFICPELTTSDANASFVQATVEMWNEGQMVQYWPFHRHQRFQYRRMTIPSYSFERSRHWLPFTGRLAVENAVNTNKDSKENEFLSMISSDGHRDADFNISPTSHRFQLLCDGHVMSGEALAPASLYFEVAARAALILQGDAQAVTWLPGVDNLIMKAPIGINKNTLILLSLRQIEGSQNSWSFSVTTQDPSPLGRQSNEPREKLKGTVSLRRRASSAVQTTQESKQFPRSNMYRWYRQIIDNPEAEKMQGNHVYRAFRAVVRYGKEFRCIKSIACVGMEAAGVVGIASQLSNPTGACTTDTVVVDGFMQAAGFLVNYFNNGDFENSLFVCQHVEHIETTNDISPGGGDYSFYTSMSFDGEDVALADVYVFDTQRKEVVFAALGFHFARVRRTSLARTLGTINKSSMESLSQYELERPSLQASSTTRALPQAECSRVEPSNGREKVIEILSNVAGVPVEHVSDHKTLEDLGIDSLAAIEVLSDIRVSLGLTIPLSDFVFFPSVKALVEYIESHLGVQDDKDTCSNGANHDAEDAQPSVPTTGIGEQTGPDGNASSGLRTCASARVECPTMTAPYDSFQEIRLAYDSLAADVGYWDEVYPDHARLLRAYTLEALSKLGCDAIGTRPGHAIPDAKRVLTQHQQLVRQLLRVLEEGHLLVESNNLFIRTEDTIDETPAEEIYNAVKTKWPEHASVHHLIHAVGSRLAECLVGERDVLEIIFGETMSRGALQDFYESWPLFRIPTNLLAEFLCRSLARYSGTGKFRILEIGAGTGGTTRPLLEALKANNIPFDYHFTDLSPSLVEAARSSFKGVASATFGTLDIEKDPPEELEGAFHVVIAANCIHATRNVRQSLINVRRMLREDGVLALVEITRNIFIFDLIFGLFTGWWLSTDGRAHALIDEHQWERKMIDAGFRDVLWTDGRCPESKTVRVIAAFPHSDTGETARKEAVRSRVKEVVYKRSGDCEILADVYCPIGPDPRKALPIGQIASRIV